MQDGLYVDCEPEAECLRRVWKLTCRARQDRGEVVYQATLKPQPVGRQRLFVPWSDFQLVRGPRLVPDMPPLSVEDVNATYQVNPNTDPNPSPSPNPNPSPNSNPNPDPNPNPNPNPNPSPNATYQVSVVATKFMLSATGETLENF